MLRLGHVLFAGALFVGSLSSPAGERDFGRASRSAATGPEVWGGLGLQLYGTGERVAPNGVPYDPLSTVGLDFNIGLLPRKRLYLFGRAEFWTQRAAASLTGNGREGISQRGYDLDLGAAWNLFGRLEFRASAFALSNLNRGVSPTTPFGFKDGTRVEARYNFASDDDYDAGRIGFISLGYYPSKTLIGGDTMEFRPGFFARAYGSYDLPGLRSYFFGDLQLIGEEPARLRLVIFDGGVAVRPFGSLENLEFRVGNELTADVQAGTNRNLAYGSVRVYFGRGKREPLKGEVPRPERWSESGPELWGAVGLKVYGMGERIAPNGAAFDPLFNLTTELNLGLLPQRKLYLFNEDEFWAQRAAPGITNSKQGKADFSKREVDVDLGLAWNVFGRFELRGSAYALNNINRGTAIDRSSGSVDGTRIEGRYYFASENLYDTSRLSFISLGYHPSGNLIGGDGTEFCPGYFARGRFSYGIPGLRSALNGDAKLIGEGAGRPRLLTLDASLAIRPFPALPNLEFRAGDEVTEDLKTGLTRNLVYGALQVGFSNR